MIIRTRRASGWAALVLATGLAAAACSSPGSSSTASTGGLTPGAGQSALAGAPGSTASGPAAMASTSTMPSTMPGMTMSAPASGQGAAAAPVSGNAVAIKNFAFSPTALKVKVGTKVTWTNEDTDAHTVTSLNNAGPLSSAALSTGQSYSYTFTKPGTYNYQCTIHPFMTASVTVTQ
jgi:plastocyanin